MAENNSPKQLLQLAKAWTENNPGAWEYIERRALEEMGANRRISISRLVEEARALNWTPRDGGAFKINNSYQAAFSRFLTEKYPRMGGYIERRRSRFDSVMPDGN